ncbi:MULTISPECIES: hypothetical protein [Nocardiopsis]|nr:MULTISPECIES: hypothetical protein [Nocardiopsis]
MENADALVAFSAIIRGMDLHSRHASALVGSDDVDTVGLRMRGEDVVVVYRADPEQRALRWGSRPLGSRLGVFQVLQSLPLGEWIPVDALTERERRILPAIPSWALKKQNRRVLRLADVPVHVDLVVIRGDEGLDTLDRACLVGLAAPRMALCATLGTDAKRALWEADYYGVGLAVTDDSDMAVLVPHRTTVPESAAALRWLLAERVHTVLESGAREAFSGAVEPSTPEPSKA